VETLLGDASKARRELGWEPKVRFEALVQEMADADLRLAERDALIKREGFQAFSHHE